MSDEMFSIVSTLRYLCYTLAVTMILISFSAIAVASRLTKIFEIFGAYLVYPLYVIVVLIVIPPIVLCWRMRQDVSP